MQCIASSEEEDEYLVPMRLDNGNFKKMFFSSMLMDLLWGISYNWRQTRNNTNIGDKLLSDLAY